jgi:hypothetical protein
MSNAVLDYYMLEGCAYFAIALHRRTGFPLAALVDEGSRWSRSLPSVAHVFVLDPATNEAIDVEGRKTIASLKDRWFDLVKPTIEHFDSEAKLRRKYMGASKPLYAYKASEIREAQALLARASVRR